MAKEGVISIRVPAAIKDAIDAAARADRRTTANLVAIILEDWLKAKGQLPAEDQPQRPTHKGR